MEIATAVIIFNTKGAKGTRRSGRRAACALCESSGHYVFHCKTLSPTLGASCSAKRSFLCATRRPRHMRCGATFGAVVCRLQIGAKSEPAPVIGRSRMHRMMPRGGHPPYHCAEPSRLGNLPRGFGDEAIHVRRASWIGFASLAMTIRVKLTSSPPPGSARRRPPAREPRPPCPPRLRTAAKRSPPAHANGR